MKRRSILLATGAIALGVSRRGNTQSATRVHRVAIVTTVARSAPFIVAIERRFRELGYVQGKNFTLEHRSLDAKLNGWPEVAADLARTKPEVVIATGSEIVLRAVRQAMGTTPIVMIAVDFDLVEKNFVATLARPGGNITGLSFRQVESAIKRLELIKETLPKATRVAALFDFLTRDQLLAVENAAKKLGFTLLPHEMRGNPYEFDAALTAAARDKVHAVLALSSGAFFSLRDQMIGAANKNRLPVFANPNYAEAGALVSFGANFPHMYARAAEYVDRILKGAKPAELPVEQATNYELIVNMKTAKALNIKIPQQILLRANRVIE